MDEERRQRTNNAKDKTRRDKTRRDGTRQDETRQAGGVWETGSNQEKLLVFFFFFFFFLGVGVGVRKQHSRVAGLGWVELS